MSSLAINTLLWVVYATRSLTLEELRSAIAINLETYDLEPRRMAPVETLINACCGLLVIEEETGVVRLVRKSFSFGRCGPHLILFSR